MTRELVFSLKDKGWWEEVTEDDSAFCFVCVSLLSLCCALSVLPLCFSCVFLSQAAKIVTHGTFPSWSLFYCENYCLSFFYGGAWEMIVWKGCEVYIKNCNEFIVDKTYNSGIDVAFRTFLLRQPPSVIYLFLRKMKPVISYVWGDWPNTLLCICASHNMTTFKWM